MNMTGPSRHILPAASVSSPSEWATSTTRCLRGGLRRTTLQDLHLDTERLQAEQPGSPDSSHVGRMWTTIWVKNLTLTGV